MRRLVGYGRLSGAEATKTLALLYVSSRLYINFFQPSFKLKSKTRDGARVNKKYHPPATPCDRLLAHPDVGQDIKTRLIGQFESLDPVRLLHQIRLAQRTLSDISASGPKTVMTAEPKSDVAVFLASLTTAWKDGEARPTHRKRAKTTHWWRNVPDPFADAWPTIEGWLIAEPTVAASVLMDRLVAMVPDAYAGKPQLRTLQRRVKAWRSQRVKEMVLGSLRRSAPMPVEV